MDRAETSALNDLRGLPELAHMLVMTSRFTETGGVLEGSDDDYAELVEFISGELADGTLSGPKARALTRLCVRIDPSCRAWLGM